MIRRFGPVRACLGLLFAVWTMTSLASATTFNREVNLVDLVGQSELILHGNIKNVTDGIDERGIPYTEITVTISEAIRGNVGSEYTFRQFGLLKPRSMGNGMVNLMVTPAGWASYTKGEETILFLHKHAKWTGLQTTVGLGQGKFKVHMGTAINQMDNAGLFKNIRVDKSAFAANQQRVMLTQSGPVNANAFVSLVKQVVQSKMVESGRMRHVQQ